MGGNITMCITKDCINNYLDKLSTAIKEYMSMPASQRSAEAIESMIEAWEMVDKLSNKLYNEEPITDEEYIKWVKSMHNDDGTVGGHWDVDTTNTYRPDDISPYCWNVAMNMMYSDYCKVAEKYGVSTAEFYSDMAKAFLHDKDGGSPKHKIKSYYRAIASKND